MRSAIAAFAVPAAPPIRLFTAAFLPPTAASITAVVAPLRRFHSASSSLRLKDKDSGAAFTFTAAVPSRPTTSASAAARQTPAAKAAATAAAAGSNATPKRLSLSELGGQLQEPSKPALGLLTTSNAPQPLMPHHVQRGVSEKLARMDRTLHLHSKKKLNYHLSQYIMRCETWSTLLPLLFEHMHHMTLHNYVRAVQRLMKLSKTRTILDPIQYNQFGRFMVQVETRLHDLNQIGLMEHVFIPYHYLRRCLKQMRVLQQQALDAEVADPERARELRRATRMAVEGERESTATTARIDASLRQSEAHTRDKRVFDRRGHKASKLRAREQRAGRAFVSVADTIRRKSGHAGAKE